MASITVFNSHLAVHTKTRNCSIGLLLGFYLNFYILHKNKLTSSKQKLNGLVIANVVTKG